MSSDQEKSTGVRNTFVVYPLGTIKGSTGGEFTVLVLDSSYVRGLGGLEKFNELLVIYYKDGDLGADAAKLEKIAGNEVYISRSMRMEGGVVLDIKPFFKELDE